MNVVAIRELIELIGKKFGQETKIEIYSDGSGRIYHERTIKHSDYLFEFDGLGELASELQD